MPAAALGARPLGGGPGKTAHGLYFRSGEYSLRLARKAGELVLKRKGMDKALAISEIPGARSTNLFAHISQISLPARINNSAWLSGKTSWCDFVVHVSFRGAIVHVHASVRAFASAPLTAEPADVATIRTPSLKQYAEPIQTLAQATPVAGSSVFVADKGMRADVLYFEDYTALSLFFNATNTDPTQGSFTYPNASTESPVGVSGSQFGYELPGAGLISLPLKQWLPLVDTYIAIGPMKSGQPQQASQYLSDTDGIVRLIGTPKEPAPKWGGIAGREIGNLSDGSNWDSDEGRRYLKSYVSDSRNSPELITQLSALLGLRELAHIGKDRSDTASKMMSTLDADLPTFFDARCGMMTNSLAKGAGIATEESWYDLTNLISLLELARLGDSAARNHLVASMPSTIKLAHKVGYVFPMQIQCPGLEVSGPSQRDVAGGYAYLMLGLYEMTHQHSYLSEAQRAIAHLLGYGFFLSYELHLTAYGAAAAAELAGMFPHKVEYRRAVEVSLANFFNSVRLWDCGYGLCAKGGYHTYMGVNPLPWSDYIAMREQYEAWLALRDFQTQTSADRTPGWMKPAVDLVNRFETATPKTMVYALPTMLPKAAAATTPSEYSFVTRNQVKWDIPLEDLREGIATSGIIGQEIYGAGGPLVFAALARQTR